MRSFGSAFPGLPSSVRSAASSFSDSARRLPSTSSLIALRSAAVLPAAAFTAASSSSSALPWASAVGLNPAACTFAALPVISASTIFFHGTVRRANAAFSASPQAAGFGCPR